VGVCAFPHVLGMEESKKNCRPPPRIISGTALKDVDLEAMPMSIFLNDDVDDDFDTIGKLVFTGSRSKVDN